MSTTPAPQESLHDIVLPQPVPWTPQTVGWAALLGILLVALGWASISLLRRRRANRYRRLALVRLERLEQALHEPSARASALSEFPILVKQTALARWPRSQVASLSGAPWLRFLDETCGGKDFSEGAGRILPTLAYSAPSARALGPGDLTALVDVVRHWIRRHRFRSDRARV